MDFSHYTDEPVRLAVDLVNTRSPLRGVDTLQTVDDLARFFAGIGREWLVPDWDLGEEDLAAVRRLRAQLRSVFHRDDDADAAGLLNAILSEVHATPRVSVHDDVPPHLHFEPLSSGPGPWLAAITAMGLSVVLVDHGSRRLGVCSSVTCGHVFIDTSRNRSRRYCSDTCATRENVAAYRRRQKD